MSGRSPIASTSTTSFADPSFRLREEDLSVLGLGAQPSRHVHHSSDRAVVEPPLESHLTERRFPDVDPDPEAEVVAAAPPVGREFGDSVTQLDGHPYRVRARIRVGEGIVEEHHQPVAREEPDGRLEAPDEGADGCVELAQHVGDDLGLDAAREGREPAQIAEQHRDRRAVHREDRSVSGRHDEVGDLRRQEPAQAR